ncbi:MAG: citrate transporter [Methylophilus sp.]|nr:citrate transporter [Methylophilus sp.]
MPIEFLLFGLTLLGVALLHRYTLQVSAAGFITISLYKLLFSEFKTGTGLSGFTQHLTHEWVLLINLLCLLTGFALLARHFEKSHIPVILPKYLPNDWKGGFVLLIIVFVLSSFLDNIAAALIGGTMAHQLYKAKLHIGFLAAIVAASNAGGAGSVVGDTTTTMMWIAGISPLQVLHAYIAAGVALLIFGVIAAHQQHAYSPILKSSHAHVLVDGIRVMIVIAMLVSALGVNFYINAYHTELADAFPWIGAALWAAIGLTTFVRRHDWEVLPETFKGTMFLLFLVLSASMMPVEKLPEASWQSTLAIGFVSAFFDNIPLTALAINQGSYDWGLLAYAVGFGGSMLWFGSSAGVALANMFPEVRSTKEWLRQGWHIIVAYLAGFTVLLGVLGWHPENPHRHMPSESLKVTVPR